MTDISAFVGSPNAYAVQHPDGSYTPHRVVIEPAVLESHMAGTESIGTYVLDFDKARFMVWDIDERDLDLARRIALAATDLCGFSPYIEFSGSKGYHVWVLLDQWYPGHEVQRVAQYIAAQSGFNGEVFPKQGVARDLGSLVKLPLGKHAVSGEWSRFLREGSVTGPGVFAAALAATPAPVLKQRASFGPQPCIESIQENPPSPGTRNNLYFHFACYLRRQGLGDDAIRVLLEAFWVNPDPGEIDSVVTNSEYSGVTCDNVPDDRHCGAACIKNRTGGLSVRRGQLRHAAEGELLVVQAGPPNHTAGIVALKHPDADDMKARLKGQP